MKKITAIYFILIATAFASVSEARVYKDKPVGKYDNSFDLRDHNGTLLNFMKEKIYPALAEESANSTGGYRDFLGAIERGEGVEIRLSDDITTLHVKYKNPYEDKAERSGRSFGVVGGATRNYIADASYAHFLRTLEKLSFKSDRQLENFYRAILYILADSDSSHLDSLSREGKQVAADFVAVYIAEQYRHLINGRDRNGSADDLGRVRLGRRHNWDDAHLQVTLLAAFHGGQSKTMRYMIYEGQLTNKVFDQNTCLYKRFDNPERETAKKRSIQLKDYWQFSYRSDCPGRSGVNITRSEFQKMGTLLTESLVQNFDSAAAETLAEELNTTTKGNLIKKVSQFFISNSAPRSLPRGGRDLVEAIVDLVMETHKEANELTESLIH